MKTLLITLSLFLWGLTSSSATNYYVRTDGNDSNTGTSNSASGAFRTITKACAIAQPGDVVNINDGIYVEGEILANNKNGSKTNVLTIRAINKHKAIIQSVSGGSAIFMNNSKGVVLDGLEVTFQNPANSYYFGILSVDSYYITVKNCFVHDIGSSGIQLNNGEYFVIENNIVRDNAKNTGNPNGSGISIYHPKYTSGYVTGEWGIIVRNNICFENICTYPLPGYETPVDGNGIILDDFENEQGGGQTGGYTHPSLVENNLSFNNGGRGIHIYHSDNLTVRNNTLYHNNTELSKYYAFGWNGDLNMDVSVGSKVYNNIVVMNNSNARGYAMLVPSDADVHNNIIIGPAGKVVNGTPQEGLLPTDNQLQQLNVQTYVKFVNPTTSIGTINTVNPQFSNYFGLASGSPAINAGNASNAASIDLEYKTRPIGGAIDIGAYESGAATPDTQAPSTPSSLSAATITSTGFTLNWTASTDNVGVTSYEVFRDGISIGTSSTTSFSVTGLTANTTYSMTVKAKDAAGNTSTASTALSVKTSAASDTQAPSVPTNLASSAITTTSFTLSWTASTDNVGVTGYEIFRNGTSIGTSATTSFNVTGLTANTTYSMTVKAKDAANNVSAASTALSVKTATAPDTQLPSTPTNLTSPSKTQTSVNLSWTASTDNVGVTGYNIYRGTTLAGSSTTTSFTVTGLTANTAYSFTVRAKDAAGNLSAPSTTLSVTTSPASDTQAPSVPTNLVSSAITTTSFTLSWTASTDNVGVASYEVFRNGTSIGTSTTTSFSVTGLTANTTYSMTVKAKDAVGNTSPASTALSVKTSTTSATGTGLKGEFFTQFGYGVSPARTAIAGKTPLFSFTATNIDYPSGATASNMANWNVWLGSDGVGGPAEAIESSTLRLSGYIQIKPEHDIQSGNSTIEVDFAVGSQGFMALTVNNTQVLIKEENWSFGTRSGRVSFPSAGYYPIELLHSTGFDNSGVELYSSIAGTSNPGHGSGLATYIIPKTVLFPQSPGARIAAETPVVTTELGIYPNPVSYNQSVLLSSDKFKDKKTQIYVQDMTGRTFLQQTHVFGDSATPLSLGSLPAGLYIILITDGKNTQQGKLVVH
ncbi:fibronectin type III domain-containing protein [Cytophagaceae bacterium DM2B3-1]|uniref:Fibronectin type III domain-containing protein n=1 Tax=Xanthocytophaga flava TaxID=3048013 RepID=A0ABT7CIY5_9BACT|nr:fibronectin type III domain-containing protein [Xanthocytophaga flavus]MDJ1493012.1 fibronectin type III domain-containing protein [Xanthocytophaga flavus]